ncbi:hypothetical protein B5M44_14105 [Shinella sumterensis]|uniref:hypothetical protein n=1 Tax=Shinella sumterensis TaxID=1967501 RepID=UPI00106E7B82|nr:hypothetical protein [Shinella sumterensis]MCD1264266.1 hypothetical protein [Shinella sumterensis]TFE97735.1 hypothetical protein B5M44_14105 [Shinella sumterensis]
MQVTDEMIEVACAYHWPGPWPGDRSEQVLAIRRENMRAALTAALSDQERAVEVEALEKAYNAGFEASSSGFNYEFCDDYERINEFTAERAGTVRDIASALVDVPVEPVATFRKALTEAAQELDRISCVPNVTETKDTYEQFQLAKTFADRGAAAAWGALRSPPPHREGEDSAEVLPADPTEDMIDAALAVDWECDGDERAAAINVWHAMRSAALAATRSASASTAKGNANEG